MMISQDKPDEFAKIRMEIKKNLEEAGYQFYHFKALNFEEGKEVYFVELQEGIASFLVDYLKFIANPRNTGSQFPCVQKSYVYHPFQIYVIEEGKIEVYKEAYQTYKDLKLKTAYEFKVIFDVHNRRK